MTNSKYIVTQISLRISHFLVLTTGEKFESDTNVSFFGDRQGSNLEYKAKIG